MKIVECVPNFSEGKNEHTFEMMKKSLRGIQNCKLLSFEPDADYNRVVVTMAGDELGILEGALSISRTAAQLIDMTKHKGEHPRMGAIDVVPFVPVKNISMEECIKISEAYAERASKELNIPIYLYEAAARKPERQNLANIRKGEYEGLAEKLKDKNWQPDYGTNEFSPKLGGTVTGARFFLIAYNVNLKSEDVKYAKEIAEILRESGYSQRDEAGNVIKVNGQPVKVPGKLKSVKGMGVALEKYKMTQVSMNLTNYNITPIHVALKEVKKEAAKLGVEVTGSEIVGLVPLESLLLAGKYYSQEKNLDEKSLVDLAIDKLGLCNLHHFAKTDKIIDYMI
jgi:glutamate formiminotransferase/formiminotetrahydrofolate cyclodeaminase